MNLKTLLLTLTTLIFIGCNPNNPTPNNKSFRHQTTPTKTQAILKLDTKGHTGKINDIIVTKSGDIISASDDKTIRVWDSKRGKEKRKILGQIGTGSEGKIYAMALSPNEEFLAVGGLLTGKTNSDKSSIRIYNYKTGVLLKILKSHTNTVQDLAFSRDGNYLISGSTDFTAKIWSIKDFSLRDTIKFHTNDVYAVKIIQKKNGYFALTAGYDNQIALYNMQSKKIVQHHKKPYKLQFLAFSKKHIAVCGFGKEIQIYDHNLKPIKTIHSETKPTGLAYSPNGELLIAGTATSPRNVNIYSVSKNYQKIKSFKKHKNTTIAVAFLDNTSAISGGGNNSEIYIWDIESNRDKKIEGIGKTVWSVGIRGDKIAWGNHSNYQSNNNRGKLQKSINLKNFQRNENLRAKSETFKRISTTYKDYALSHRKGGDYGYGDAVLEIKKGSENISITRDATNGYRHRCYGFYKNYIVSGGLSGQLKIYNLQGKEVANLVGHTGEVWSIALDGDRLVSGSSDQTIRVWDLSRLKRQMQPQLNLFISKTNEWIAWTPQGFYDASKGGEKYIGYHINQGSEKEATFETIDKFYKFHRKDLIQKALNGEDLTPYAQKINLNKLLSSGIPPKVKIVNPSDTYNNPNKKGEYTLDIELCHQGVWHGDVKIYRDGVPVATVSQNTRAFRHQRVVSEKCSILESVVVSLSNGENLLGVKAITEEDVESNFDSRMVRYQSLEKKKSNLYIVTLSVNEYDDDRVNDLHYANADADAIITNIKKVGKLHFENIYSHSLKDKEVTKENILKTFKALGKKTKADDVFVLFLSGHGKFDKILKEYFFIPRNCYVDSDLQKKAIGQKVLFNALSHIQAGKSVLLLDTCESGGVVSKEVENSTLKAFGSRTNRAILSASTKSQYAREGYKNHGVFTYTLIEAMNNPNVYDYKKRLTITNIAGFVKNEMPEKTKKKWGQIQNAKFFNSNTNMEIVIGEEK